MKRWIIILITFPLFTILHAQNRGLSSYEYWIDRNYDNHKKVSLSQVEENISFSIDTKDLIEGIHDISLRIQDTDGNWSGIVSSYYFVTRYKRNEGTRVTSCEYWIDDDYTQRRTADVSGESFALTLDMMQLHSGMHTVSLRMKDDKNNFTGIVRSYCFVRPVPEQTAGEVVSCEYWIDNDFAQRKTVSVSGENIALALDMSELTNGKHTISMRVTNEQGNYSGVITDSFYKFSVEEEAGKIVACEYWTDEDFANKKEVAIGNDGTVTFSIDASSQTDGMHMLSWRIRDDKGKYGGLNSSMYFKHTTVAPAENITWYQYWWNDRADMAVRNDVSSNGIFTLEDIVEVPDYVSETRGLETGTAEFHILFGNDKGIISNIITETVTDKIPPTSHMNPLPSTQETSRQELSWSGTDKWSGVMDYTVYVYNDMEEQFVPYVENTSDTVITYYCSQKDHVVKFFVIARDSMGNVEPMKTEAETEVRFMYVDVYPPTTELQASSETVNVGEAVELTWRSIDDSNDIAVTNIYYSEDDRPLILWKTVAGESTATFKGKAGSTYHFIVTACDTEGNLEKPNIAKAVKVHFNN